MGTLIQSEGLKNKTVLPADGHRYTLEEMQKMVGGNIQPIILPSGWCMVVNEEGRLKNLPINREATEIWKEEYSKDKYPFNNDGFVVGDVIFGTAYECGFDRKIDDLVDELHELLMDEDLDETKLKDAAHNLLPAIVDELAHLGYGNL